MTLDHPEPHETTLGQHMSLQFSLGHGR